MKLAFISTMGAAPWGGSEALWSETAKLALQQNHQVFTSGYYWPETPRQLQELARMGAQVTFRPRYSSALSVRMLNRIKSLINSNSPEIKSILAFNPERIILNQGGSYDLLYKPDLLEFLLQTNIPYFIVCHSYREALILTEEERKVLVRVFNKARHVFMVSTSQANIIKRQLVHAIPNLRFITNPVNLNSLKPVAFPEAKEINFAIVGGLHVAVKGQDVVLDVLSREPWNNRDWILNIYGDGPDKSYLEDLIQFYSLQNRVFLRGHVSNIQELWRQNHLFLLSSRVETGPMVLSEAMICGRPAVATLVGKVPELIQDGFNGFIAGAAMVPLLNEALERAWQHKDNWAAMGQVAHTTALKQLDLNGAEKFLNYLIAP